MGSLLLLNEVHVSELIAIAVNRQTGSRPHRI